MIADKLKELEDRVKAAVALVAKVKSAKASLEQRVEELQAEIAGHAKQIRAVEAGRKKDEEHLHRLQEEREQVRLKVDRLLEEIRKLEASVEPKR